MRLFGLQIGGVNDGDLARLRAAAPTYEHVGSTLDERRGFEGRHEVQMTVGFGEAAFEAARRSLRSWRPQRSLGASITPAGVEPDLGETVLLVVGAIRGGTFRVVVPNRIVAVVDGPGRYGYAYGTLPGHPERGEELFLLEQRANGDVVFTVRVDAEPAGGLRRVGFLVRPLQRAALRRYLEAVAKDVRSCGTPA